MIRILLMVLFFILNVANTDAQTEWKEHNSPVTGADLHNLFFANDSLGWIISHNTGTVLHTKNGGETWFIQAQMDSMYFESVYFLNEQTGWISGENGLIFKTTDGGTNWEQNKISGDSAWIYSVYFFNKKAGIAVGLWENKHSPVFLKTKDGGANWKNLKEKVPTSFYESISFINKQRGYVGGGGKIIFTNDGGNSWKMQFSDIIENSDCREVIRGLTFVTPELGWAVGQCGLILKTEDGQTWKRLDKFTKNRLRDIAFVNESEGYVVGDSNRKSGVLYHTNNGGMTWKPILNKVPDLHRIELTETKIWLVGDDGIILSKSR